jgi:hypothetical protein
MGGEMDTHRRNAVWAGIFYIAATVAPISTVFFVGFLGGEIAGGGPIPDYLAYASSHQASVVVGMFIELLYALAVVGIIANLFPILKKHDEASALGFFSLRLIEAVSVVIGSIILLTLLPLSREFVVAGSPDGSHYGSAGRFLLSARDWAFLIGSGIFWSLSAVLLNYVLYRSRLVPRWISIWGFFGALLSLAAYVLKFAGVETPEFLFYPIALQEMAFAVWLIAKGVAPHGSATEPL